MLVEGDQYAAPRYKVQSRCTDMATKKSTLTETRRKATAIERADDMDRLKSMVERAIAAEAREPKFVFDLDKFLRWVRSYGYTVSGPELQYWKGVAEGRNRPRSHIERRDRVNPHRGNKLGEGSLPGLSTISQEEARSRLLAAFQTFSSGKDTPQSKSILQVLKALNSLRYRPDTGQKVEEDDGSRVPLPAKRPTGGGAIEDKEPPAPVTLPETPPKFWVSPKPGRPPASEAGRLIAFLDDVYAQFLPLHRDSLRPYILEHDPKLYKAIQNFERSHTLPTHLTMTTQNERVLTTSQQRRAEPLNQPGACRCGP